VLGDRLQHLRAGGLGRLPQVGWDVFDLVVGAQFSLATPRQRLHLQKVDHADEVRLRPDRKLQQNWDGIEPLTNCADAEIEVRTRPVKLVDIANPGDTVLGCLTPHGHGLRLDARHAVEHGHRAIQDAQGTLHLHGEVHVAGGVDDVDLVIVPEARGRGGRDGDPALLLLLHPVHRRGAVMHLADLVVDAGVVQDPLGGGGLPGVNVRHDADVAHLGEICLQVESHCY